jgi:hypothetical protein
MSVRALSDRADPHDWNAIPEDVGSATFADNPEERLDAASSGAGIEAAVDAAGEDHGLFH